MTALALNRIVAEALADVGITVTPSSAEGPRGRARKTVWLPIGQKFGIRSYTSGRKVYIVQARMAGRARTVTIAPTSIISETEAERIAQRVIAHALVGEDPATERQRIRKTPSFARFLDEYWNKCGPAWKPSTRETNGVYRRLYLDGAFAERYVDTISHADVLKWFKTVSYTSGPGGANRCLSVLQAMMNRAEAWGYRPEHSNPVAGIRWNKRRICTRFLSEPELARLGTTLKAEPESNRVHAAAVSLLLLTGCRVREVLTLEWGDVAGNRLKLRDSKTGPRVVWLGDDARAVVDTLPRHSKVPRLFWNVRFRKPIRHLHHYWKEVSTRAGLHDVRLHDLRHTFASHAAMQAETIPMIGRLLGHAKVASTARYAHLDDAHTIGVAERIGLLIEQMMR